MNSFLDKMRSWIPAHAPEWVFKASMAVWEAYKNLTMPEQKKSFGNKNPDKTFFVIRLYPPAAGFLADYNYVLGYMKYAYDNGWIPVVDMQNYQTLYNEDHPIHGTTNVWEYFFEQPLDPATGKQAIELIDTIQQKTDTTVLIIEHRLEDVLWRNVDRIVLVNEGRILADMRPDDLLSGSLLAENGIRLEYSDKAREWIASAGYDPLYGARPVKRVIQRYVVNDLSKRILAGDVNREQPIRIDADDKGLTFAN